MIAVLAAVLLAGTGLETDYQKLVAAAKFSLAEAIEKGLAETREGVPIQVEIEEEAGVVVYSVDIAVGTKVRSLLLDVRDGKVLEHDLDDEDHSAVVTACKIPLVAAIEAALEDQLGQAVFAALGLKDGKPIARVQVFAGGKVSEVVLDGSSVPAKPAVAPQVPAAGKAAARQEEAQEAADDGRAFTEIFGEDPRDLASTGTNPYFILEVGYTLILEGKEGKKDAKITITVTDRTRTIDGVEARAVEEKEEIGGQIVEVTQDYFVISRRTNNVYYFGEEVDKYKDGKLVNHEGAWLSGENGARYGLLMPAAPLLGARYHQEIAPGVAMDRAEVVSLSDTFECPAGKFENVLMTEETNPLEKGEREYKRYARGVGLLHDGGLKLTKYGMRVQ